MESGEHLVFDQHIYAHEQRTISKNGEYEIEIWNTVAEENSHIISAYVVSDGKTKAYIDIRDDSKSRKNFEYLLTSNNVEK